MTKKQAGTRGARTLCLIDGTALAYRSYYAFIRRPLVNSRGENVSAIYGFASSLLKLLTDVDPDYVAVAFDTAEPTFRHEAYEEYKATREEMPDDMSGQLPVIRELVEALRIPVLEEPGYEADDLIGTVAVQAGGEGIRSIVVSGDKDFFQLVDDQTTVLDPAKGVEYTPKEVERSFGVPPARVTEVLGLMGDSSDNVPGVPGIGKKTATDLIVRYGTIEAVLEHVGEIGGAKRRENLTEYAQQALMSRDLVTIDLEAPVSFDRKELERTGADYERVKELFREYEFPSLMKLVVPERGADGCDYATVTTVAGFQELLQELKTSGGFAVDLETTSLDPISAEIVGIAVSHQEGRALYIPVGHARGKSLTRDRVLEGLRPLLEDPELPKYGQNVKYDYEVLLMHGIEMAPLAFDTMIASYVLDPGQRQHGLAALALKHLERGTRSIESLIGKGSEQLSFAEVDLESASDYACEDAEVTYRLSKLLADRVEEEGLTRLFESVEMPLVEVLAGMELAGVALDVPLLERLGERFGREIDEIKRALYELCGVEFNPDSPKQVGEVLFERLDLPRGRRTKTGYSTDTSVLETLKDAHEAPRLLLSYRQLKKLKAGYADALPKLVHPETGRLHTSFNQTVASTGRLSSSNPNLQNIPIRTDVGREIRKAFVAGEGKTFLSADYSQIELRIMAHLSADDALREAFHAGKDIHRSTASLIFGASEDEITPAQRDWAKTVNFGIIYGMSQYGLAKGLGIGNDEAAEFIDRYFGTYPRVKEYTARSVEEAAELGYATTMLGRRRPIAGLSADNARARSIAERIAINTPIQGSAADLIKVAMLGVDRRIASENLPCTMVLQVHDELIFEVDEGAVGAASKAIRDEMENPEGFELTVPIVVNVAEGQSWFEAHP